MGKASVVHRSVAGVCRMGAHAEELGGDSGGSGADLRGLYSPDECGGGSTPRRAGRTVRAVYEADETLTAGLLLSENRALRIAVRSPHLRVRTLATATDHWSLITFFG